MNCRKKIEVYQRIALENQKDWEGDSDSDNERPQKQKKQKIQEMVEALKPKLGKDNPLQLTS